MSKQSLVSRLGARTLPFFSSRVFTDDWMAAGNDRVQLRLAAANRRRTDGSRPDLLLRRRWTLTSTEVAGRELHVLTPKSGSTGRLLFYCHGGAYVVGPSAIEWLNAASLARKLDADLALYDYPKAPEFGADDTLPATWQAWAEATQPYEPGRVVIAGTSAGGGLAASLMLHLARTGRPLPCGALLISPWLDLAIAHPDAEGHDAADVLLPIDRLRRDGEVYAGKRDLTDPLLSPRYADDRSLAAVPPLLITAGEREILLPEARELTERVKAAGGSAELLIEPFGQHATALVPLPETKAIRAEIVDTCRTWLLDDGRP